MQTAKLDTVRSFSGRCAQDKSESCACESCEMATTSWLLCQGVSHRVATKNSGKWWSMMKYTLLWATIDLGLKCVRKLDSIARLKYKVYHWLIAWCRSLSGWMASTFLSWQLPITFDISRCHIKGNEKMYVAIPACLHDWGTQNNTWLPLFCGRTSEQVGRMLPANTHVVMAVSYCCLQRGVYSTYCVTSY